MAHPCGSDLYKRREIFQLEAGVGGGGSIDLVIHLMDYDFKSSVDWLYRHFSLSDIDFRYIYIQQSKGESK